MRLEKIFNHITNETSDAKVFTHGIDSEIDFNDPTDQEEIRKFKKFESDLRKENFFFWKAIRNNNGKVEMIYIKSESPDFINLHK